MNCKTCKHWEAHQIIAVPAVDYYGPLKKYGDCRKITKGTAIAYLRRSKSDLNGVEILSTDENFSCALYEEVKS